MLAVFWCLIFAYFSGVLLLALKPIQPFLDTTNLNFVHTIVRELNVIRVRSQLKEGCKIRSYVKGRKKPILYGSAYLFD